MILSDYVCNPMKAVNYVLIIILIVSFTICNGQNNKFDDWTDKQKKQYRILDELAHYVSNKDNIELSKDILFENYIEFEYVLQDTILDRKESRIQKYDGLFYYFRKTIDSLGIENLDAKPIRFYKDHEIYEPFENLTNGPFKNHLSEQEKNVFAYYEKDMPEQPKGVLLFDNESNKLLAWILLNQGGYRFFLLFNIMYSIIDDLTFYER